LEGFKKTGIELDRIQEAFIIQSIIMKTSAIDVDGAVACYSLSMQGSRVIPVSIAGAVIHSVNRKILAVRAPSTSFVDVSCLLCSGVYGDKVLKDVSK